ncbi:protein EFR3 homolog B-like isoform X2 [Lineus longissimus]|uniref:protein EFR3 homolog B-like isoform X2 n=1 Tax=Lineus longissimus TaxID=88925 RepID=UPI002B4DB0EC
MSMCMACCADCKPRYKRLVDSIFPTNLQDGLVKSNMEKLTFYALSSPEKLDRIGDYLAKKLSHDVHRHRVGHVFVAMEALDQLLVACHAQSVNIFVESFLKMVQKLLECEEPDLKVLATTSFVKFSNVEEDTPSYHRRYDFFVSKFSSMCHNGDENSEVCLKIRVAGLRGLQGVVRKTVSDDLQVNIWESTHMDKIVPSLLFNLQEINGLKDHDSPHDEDKPAVVAENCFRDLVCRASYGNIKSVISPVLIHLDNHSLWVPNDFAVKCFRMIMYSVQSNYSHLVVQFLMSHLDRHTKSEPKIKASIVDVLSETVLIAAGGSIGPSVLEVFNTLLRHLRISIDSVQAADEKRFQEAIINTIGEFANNLPDYQKIEIMMFVMGKMPVPTEDEPEVNSSDILLQTMLLKTLLKVATKYRTVLLVNAFPSAFLEPLLKMSVVSDSGIRLIVQKILHTLLDRHENSGELLTVRIPKDIAQLDLSIESPPRQDIMFMKKHGMLLCYHLYENAAMENNKKVDFEALYCTLALLCIETGSDEILPDLVKLALEIQQLATNNSDLTFTHQCIMHAMVAAYLNLISQLTAIPALCQHVTKVIQTRETEAAHLLPETAFKQLKLRNSPSSSEINEIWLFSKTMIGEALKSAGHDTSRLDTPYVNKLSGVGIDVPDRTVSISDIHSMSLDVDSVHSSPGLGPRRYPEELITYETLKKELVENDERALLEEEEKSKEIYETFRKGTFEEIVAKSEAKSQQFHNKLNEILDMITQSNENLTSVTMVQDQKPKLPQEENSSTNVFEMQFPDLFVY